MRACTKPCVLTRLRARLQPLSLEVRDIKADGHCLYRSLEDQLALEQGAWQAAEPRSRLAPPRLVSLLRIS